MIYQMEWVMIDGKDTRLTENLKTELFYDNKPIDVSGILMSKNHN